MSLLDCGSGPGTNTVRLAETVALGEVAGIDIERSQIELAKVHAAERGVSNIRSEVADAYDLPFSDASFDPHSLTQACNTLRTQQWPLRKYTGC